MKNVPTCVYVHRWLIDWTQKTLNVPKTGMFMALLPVDNAWDLGLLFLTPSYI